MPTKKQVEQERLVPVTTTIPLWAKEMIKDDAVSNGRSFVKELHFLIMEVLNG